MKIFSKNSNYEKYYKGLIPYLKKEKNQKYFLIILSLSASIFFIIFAINPTLSTIAKLKKQSSDAEFVEAKLSQKVANISSLSNQYNSLRDDLHYVTDAIPQNPEAPTLVGQIQSIGTTSNVQITNVEVLPVILSSGNSVKSSSFVFDITGNASFENIQTFMKNLTSMQRVVSIASFQISKNTKDENTLDFIIRGRAYFKK